MENLRQTELTVFGTKKLLILVLLQALHSPMLDPTPRCVPSKPQGLVDVLCISSCVAPGADHVWPSQLAKVIKLKWMRNSRSTRKILKDDQGPPQLIL